MDEQEIKAILQAMKNQKAENERQTKIIIQLQDQIRLLKFDISEGLKEISKLKYKANSRKKTMQQIKTNLERIMKTSKYEDLNKVVAMITEEEGTIYDIK